MIGTAELNFVRRTYQPMDDVETSPPVRYGGSFSSVGNNAVAESYRSVSRDLRAHAACFIYEGASSFEHHAYERVNFDHGVGALFFDSQISRAVLKCGALAKKVASYSVALLSDADSTVSSPKMDARLHIHNLKQYEITFSRRRALNYMFNTLEDAFERKEVEMLNCLLYSAADDLRDSGLGVSLLRATFRARKELAMWNFYRDVIQRSLHDHPDAKKLLRGLLG